MGVYTRFLQPTINENKTIIINEISNWVLKNFISLKTIYDKLYIDIFIGVS
jgi:hypothetical protein